MKDADILHIIACQNESIVINDLRFIIGGIAEVCNKFLGKLCVNHGNLLFPVRLF
ncbi:hypothetical protein SDC9_118684 [bioreactor metagenome]|uniref:Uncharacterized protein n=1 Tax=bioreactor metagenome TaxID=1076179 RepID=A0A645C927_9ZZZZ